MSLQPTLEDVLHLVAWNGYSKDIRHAVGINRSILTDERIWFPFGMKDRYGSKEKGFLQILAENDTASEYFLSRFNTLKEMAKITSHMKLLLSQIDVRDTEGESALTAAIKTKCFNTVKLLVEHGADINQKNKKGRSALNLAIACEKDTRAMKNKYKKEKKLSQKIVSYLTRLGAIDIPKNHLYEDWLNIWRNIGREMDVFPELIDGPINWDDRLSYITKPYNEPKPEAKWLKSSLYKQQFGRR